MKKHILVLLFLLLALIITCVYQKTYTVYSHLYGEENTSTQNEIVIKSTETEQATKQQLLTDTSTKRDVIEKTVQTIHSATAAKNEMPTSSTTENMHTQTEEKEVIDYLLSVMKKRDIALIQRDEEEAKLHALIKNVLENRRLAIENMLQVSTQIDKEHQARLAERDAKAHNTSQEKGK